MLFMLIKYDIRFSIMLNFSKIYHPLPIIYFIKMKNEIIRSMSNTHSVMHFS